MTPQDWLNFADHLEIRAASCLDESEKATNDVYFIYHLLGRASAFRDCAYMIRKRLEADE